MATLYIDGSVVWLGLMLLVYWNLFRVYSDLSVTLLWNLMIGAVKYVVRRVFRVIEWASGVNVQGTGELASNSLDNAMDARLLWPVPALVVLGCLAGTKATTAWCDAFLLVLVIMCWSSRVEWQTAAWPDRECWRFRAFTLVSGCLALLSAALQWSFFATSPRPRDPANETVYYTLILWSATLSIQILQALIFIGLHFLYSVTALGRRQGGFDPIEKTGLFVRCVGSAASFLAALNYCSDGATTFMKLAVVTHFCFMMNEVLILHRSNNLLRSFPEVSLSGYCVICLEPIKPRERARKLHCGHIFHSRCLYRWLMRSDQCPTCRQPTDPMRDYMVTSIDLAMDHRHGRGRRIQNMQDIGVQTTFEIEYVSRPSTFHGSMRPLLRSTNPTLETMPLYSVGNSSARATGGRSTVSEKPERLPSTPPQPHGKVQFVEAIAPCAGPPSAATELDEFADNPIVWVTGRNSKRKRRGAAAEEKAKASATVVEDSGDDDEDGTAMDTVPHKRVKLEETERGSVG
ncbi:hypothetical protein C3747_272g2 [Trypanosoma cruzi]|uniref:RING-type domain-containing protein n=1 Tax=Trypanosoma cruzi TaxID=5693 RepID=A0A2V2VFF2_TRYCR|nr:hypothetical protein C3747_272g2 [Trypanosoma cruzi]